MLQKTNELEGRRRRRREGGYTSPIGGLLNRVWHLQRSTPTLLWCSHNATLSSTKASPVVDAGARARWSCGRENQPTSGSSGNGWRVHYQMYGWMEEKEVEPQSDERQMMPAVAMPTLKHMLLMVTTWGTVKYFCLARLEQHSLVLFAMRSNSERKARLSMVGGWGGGVAMFNGWAGRINFVGNPLSRSLSAAADAAACTE